MMKAKGREQFRQLVEQFADIFDEPEPVALFGPVALSPNDVPMFLMFGISRETPLKNVTIHGKGWSGRTMEKARRDLIETVRRLYPEATVHAFDHVRDLVVFCDERWPSEQTKTWRAIVAEQDADGPHGAA